MKCTHTYNHLAVVEGNGRISPCCQYDSSEDKDFWTHTIYEKDSLDGILASDKWQEIREAIKNKCGECIACWNDENNGVVSRREWSNEVMPDHKEFILEDLEIGLDYTCNMMCRSCKPDQSSKWNSATGVLDTLLPFEPMRYEKSNNHSKFTKDMKRILENSDLSNLRLVRLVGGEPFYSKSFDWFIDKLYNETDVKNLEFAVSTNASIIPKMETMHKILEMKKVRIDLSLDAVGDLASTIRWGVDWEIVKENVLRWVRLATMHKNIVLQCHPTISILNVNKLQELVDFLDEQKIEFSASMLRGPEYLDLNQIPLEYRKQWQVKNPSGKNQNMYDDLNKMICSTYDAKNKLNQFIISCHTLDDHQGNKFIDVNSEIYKLAEELTNG